MTKQEIEFKILANEARIAGLEAVKAFTPEPMVVVGGGQRYFVEDGVCGFAWVTIRPGTSPFARFAKKHLGARKAYEGGVQIWVSEFNQSMEKKETYAQAYAKVLSEAGIKAYPGSRMD